MTTTALQDDIHALLYDIAPRDLEAKADAMSSADRGRLAQELQNVALAAVWRSAYLDARYGSGCGDQGHASAVKAANKQLTGTRKALGFTYPDRGAINV